MRYWTMTRRLIWTKSQQQSITVIPSTNLISTRFHITTTTTTRLVLLIRYTRRAEFTSRTIRATCSVYLVKGVPSSHRRTAMDLSDYEILRSIRTRPLHWTTAKLPSVQECRSSKERLPRHLHSKMAHRSRIQRLCVVAAKKVKIPPCSRKWQTTFWVPLELPGRIQTRPHLVVKDREMVITMLISLILTTATTRAACNTTIQMTWKRI